MHLLPKHESAFRPSWSWKNEFPLKLTFMFAENAFYTIGKTALIGKARKTRIL